MKVEDQRKMFIKFIEYENDCWIKKGSISDYPTIYFGNYRQSSGHRLSYKIFVGEIPKDCIVMHSCDNRRCVNPEHLFLGTHSLNLKDAHLKGRLTDKRILIEKKILELMYLIYEIPAER